MKKIVHKPFSKSDIDKSSHFETASSNINAKDPFGEPEVNRVILSTATCTDKELFTYAHQTYNQGKDKTTELMKSCDRLINSAWFNDSLIFEINIFRDYLLSTGIQKICITENLCD